MAKRIINFIDKGEKFLKIFVLILFCLVIITQFLLTYKPIARQITLLERLEGQKMENSFEYPASKFNVGVNNITFKVMTPYISSLPHGKIIVNKKKVNDFTNLQATIGVKPNDKVTLDFSWYSLDLDIKIISTGKIKVPQGIIHIKKGTTYTFYVHQPD